MLPFSVTVSPVLQQKIKQIISANNKARDMVDKALMDSAIEIQASAKEIVPVMTGALRRSIGIFQDIDRSRAAGKINIGSNLVYAPVQEYSERDHPVIEVSTSGKIRGNTNPDATWGFLRKSLIKEWPNFVERLQKLAYIFSGGEE